MILGNMQLDWSPSYLLNFTKWIECRLGVYVIYRIGVLNYHEAVYVGMTENRSLGERLQDHTMPSDVVQQYRNDVLFVQYAPISYGYERTFAESYLAEKLKPLISTRVSNFQLSVNLPRGFIDITSTFRKLSNWAAKQ